MPVVGDPAACDSEHVERDEVDRLAVAGEPVEVTGERSAEVQARRDAVGDDQELLDGAVESVSDSTTLPRPERVSPSS
jgi:hypothetical protein